MKAIAIDEFGGREKLLLRDLPDPVPGAGEVRIRVRAAGVNPVDWKIREGLLKDRLPHAFPLIPGWDVAGIVDRLGPGVTAWKPGDAVYAYARKPIVRDGCYAEYVVLPSSHLAHKPERLDFVHAAAIPLAGLTAYQVLFDAARLQPGDAVLVHAAAGGVGSFAVQLAAAHGCCVLGTAGPAHADYVRLLGARGCIDYHHVDFRKAVRVSHPDGVQVVVDALGGETLQRSVEVLAEGGRLVSIVDPEGVERLRAQGVSAHYVFVQPDQAQLEDLGQKVKAGTLRVHVAAVFPLAEAASAHEMIESRHVGGKIVLRVD